MADMKKVYDDLIIINLYMKLYYLVLLPNFVTLITSDSETLKFENSASLLSICQPQAREGAEGSRLCFVLLSCCAF